MLTPDVTAIILGGGAAGLQLGAACARAGVTATIIEPREQYTNDRTWSFWALPDHGFADCEIGRWSRWSVALGDAIALRQSDTQVYVSLAADRVYDRLTGIIDQHATVTLHRGVSAHGEARRLDDRKLWSVETDLGTLTARYIFDSRPQTPVQSTYGQYFLGHEVRTNRACFTPDTAQLMHFRINPDGDGIDFLYTLPFAADHALVEVTRFTATQPDKPAMAAWLDREIMAMTHGAGAECLRQEAGFLPMAVRKTACHHGAGYCRIGLAGGAGRPSTGYAFVRMGQAASRLTGQVLDGRDSPGVRFDGPISQWMDQVFLRVLQRHPRRGPNLLHQLFQRAPTDRLERFLEGSDALRDRLAVMRSLPAGPFLRAALVVRSANGER